MVVKDKSLKIKALLPLWLVMLCMSTASNAQLSDQLSRNYSPVVIKQIKEINSHTKLTAEKQTEIARYFFTRLKDSGGITAVETKGLMLSPELQNILGAASYADFITGYSPLDAAPVHWIIKFRNELKLSKEALDKFVKSSKNLQGSEKQSEVLPAQNKIINETLSESQQKLYCDKRAYVEANTSRKNIFTILRTRNSLSLFDTAKLSKAILSFEARRISTRNLLVLTNRLSPEIRLEDAKVLLEKPFIIYQAEAYSSLLPSSSLKDMLEVRKELNLSASKVDSLISYAAELDRAKTDNYIKGQKFNAEAFQDSRLLKILQEDYEIENFVRLKNRENIFLQSKQEWKELMNFKLVNESEQNKVLEDLQSYHSKVVVANELFRLKKNRRTAFVRVELMDNPPELLTKLKKSKQVDLN